ncbi:hypothetical protein, partial [Aetokthonos hydrillicola]|uniref:ApeA N-terminal domain 1-containing protein n=1 Tax=Aetokthonos hydrillicola TaxID=1550245 RepID=UPI001ABB2941
MTTSPISGDRDDKELICQDVASGLSGRLSLSDLKVTLTSFGDPIPSPKTDILHFVLEKRGYASLLQWFEGGGQQTYGTAATFTSQEYIANTILIGPRPWRSTDRIRYASFTFTNAEIALHYAEHLNDRGVRKRASKRKQYLHVDVYAPHRSEIISLRSASLSITLRMLTTVGGSGGFLNSRITSIPQVILSFPKHITLEETYRKIKDVLTFFELSIGTACRVAKVSVSPESREAFDSYWSRNEMPPLFDVYWHFPELKPTRTRLHPSVAIFKAYKRSTRTDLGKRLIVWLERRADWYVTYELMSSYLATERAYSSVRILRLMAWFESLPLYQQRLKISSKQIDKLAERSKRAARELGISTTEQRLRETLSALRYPSLASRIERAIKKLRVRFGKEIVGSDLIELCLTGIKIRNHAAHGNTPLRLDTRTRLDV